jgi:hypothetical protein
VDCPRCKAKVAAEEHARINQPGGFDPENDDVHYGISVGLGKCPRCRLILVGESQQVAIKGYDGYEDEWADPVRVYPVPPRAFTSPRIPRVVSDSITEGVKSLQANANGAACVMFGRALEAICRNILDTSVSDDTTQAAVTSGRRPIMLGEGIRKLKDAGIIDERLFDWSQQLHAFRNLAAHPTDIAISREEADDLRTFVFAIVEYIYDLTDRYNDFKERLESKKQRAAN